MLAKKTSKNQLTLPKEIVKEFPNAEYFDIRVEGRTIILTPVSISPDTDLLEEMRDKIQKLGIVEKDVDDAIRWVRGKAR